MMRLFSRRLFTAAFAIVGAATLVFLMLRLVPGDPAELILGDRAQAQDLMQFRAQHCLDRPLWAQYGCFWSDILDGSLGHSMTRPGHTVFTLIAENAPPSVELALAAMALAIAVAWPLGLIAALRPQGAIDLMISAVSVLGITIPNFWLGNLLLIVFAISLDWLPVSGETTGLLNLVLPAMTLGLALAAKQSQMLRTSVIEVRTEPWVTAVRARGISESRLLFTYVLPLAIIPVVTVVGMQLGAILVGTVITEEVFARPGLGSLLLEGVHRRDFAIVQGCVLLISFVYVCVNLLTDLVYLALDPRVRREA